MIAFIKGEIAAIEDNCVILESNHIGYEIFMPASAVENALREGEEVRIHTYLHVKEDALQLYGFLTREDLKLFKCLLGVNGIGPKAALGILSALTADELRFAILSDDVAAISRAPGIGKKTAQKLILELKDKLSLEDAFEQKLSNHQSPVSSEALDSRSEAVLALTALGYSNALALKAVQAVKGWETMDVEALLKAALKNL
jgi:Holliday junction DNA helicase RuvA